MFDIGWPEMLVIAVVLIVVVGPKDLPKMLRTFGRTTAKLRVMAGDFRKQFDEALKEAELDDLKSVADDMRALNPKNEIRKALSPMEKAAQDVRSGLDAAMKPTKPAAAEPAPAEAKAAEPVKTGATAMPGEAAAATKPSPKAPAKANGAAAPAIKKVAAPKQAAAKPSAKTTAAKKPAASSAKATAAPKKATKPKSGGSAA
ncbi:MAG: Sec-independent protein translocase protein TatB [Mesorhizobium sp.]|nr:Sec-independent protein translocase protein TatB [Mesorhizobium sp.]